MAPTITSVHYEVGPYLLAVWFICAALMDPIVDPNMLGVLNSVIPYVFILSFFAWVILMCVWVGSIIVRREWHRLVGRFVVRTVKWVWAELKSLGRFYFVKFIVAILLIIFVLLSAKWFIYHFDITVLVTEMVDFIVNLWRAILNVDELIAVVNGWVNKIFIRWMIAYLASFVNFAQEFVQAHPIGGVFLIGSIAVGTIGFLVFVGHVKVFGPNNNRPQ
jgi:hypothetical protein